MNELQTYLDQHYFTETAALGLLGISQNRFNELLRLGVFAAPSYVIRGQRLFSVVFGEFDADGFVDASYFHRDMLPWMARAAKLGEQFPIAELSKMMEQEFKRDFATALEDWHRKEWPMPDAFNANGEAIDIGLAKRCETNWRHYQAGIFGLCVARPVSAAAIVEKEVLQEKLTALSENGAISNFAEVDIPLLLDLIARYETASMPFTYLEYPRSSRFRLADQLRKRLVNHVNKT